MIIALDKDLNTIQVAQQVYSNVEFWQFRTPLTQYKSGEIPYILDNGAYSDFDERKFCRMVKDAKFDPYCRFIIAPDVVGDAMATYLQYQHYNNFLGIPYGKRGFVLQDGVSDETFPAWDDFDCLFIGGSTEFKMSKLCYEIAQAAILEGKHVHVGRVNTPARIVRWFGNCHTIDGSGISRFNGMLEEACRAIENCQKYRQKTLAEWI